MMFLTGEGWLCRSCVRGFCCPHPAVQIDTPGVNKYIQIEVYMSDTDRFDNDIVSRAEQISGAGSVKRDEPMSTHTTFRVGGSADYFVRPRSAGEIAALIELCRDRGIPYFILGNGSNLLVSDKGYRGMIINIMDNMGEISVCGSRIRAGAGAMLIKVNTLAKDNSLTGLEFASGIPGTVGGAVYMNAGAYGGEMKDVISSVTAIDEDGRQYTFGRDEMDFSYRHSIIEDRKLIVVETEFELSEGSRDEIEARVSELSLARRTKQPLEYPSAGSTFKRPEGYFAGKLIMDAGLRGYTVGGAQVSEKHCGFVVNRGGATAEDVMTLIRDVQQKVADRFGVRLETEVKLLGDFCEESET